MLNKLKLKQKLVTIFLLVGLLPLLFLAYETYQISSKALEDESFNKLTSVRELKKDQIEKYFVQIQNQVLTFSEDQMIVSAMKDFKRAFKNLIKEQKVSKETLSDYEAVVRDYYNSEYLTRLNKNLKTPQTIEPYWPGEDVSTYLQYFYCANNSHPTGNKHDLDFAEDGSSYSKIHEKFHPIIKDYLLKFGYYDIFLVDPETGHIVYTVFKEVDYSTSLLTGPYKNTNFAKAFRNAMNANEKDFVSLVDFEPYDPSYSAPASFIASPIFDGDEKVGVLLFQMPIDEINRVMTSDEKWTETGLGLSGETYLVANDMKLRSNSRFLLEDKDAYLKALEGAGENSEVVNRIDLLETSILLQSCNTIAAQDALNGIKGKKIILDYREVPVLSSYTPLEIKGLNWALMAEIDEEEAFAASNSILNTIILLGLLCAILVIIIGYYTARSISRPIVLLQETAKKISDGDLSQQINIENRSDEIGALQSAIAKTVSLILNKIFWYEQLLDSIPFPISVTDNNNEWTFVNKQAVEKIGQPKEKILEQKIPETNSEENKPAWLKNRNEDDTFQIDNSSILNESGEVIGNIEIVQDITEKNKLKSRLEYGTKILSDHMIKFKSGDLTVAINDNTEDEIGIVLNGFTQAVENINKLMTHVNDVIESTASASRQIDTRTGELSSSATEQNIQTTDIASSIEEMTRTIIETTSNASQAADSAQQAGKLAKEGGQIVSETIEGMNRIANVVISSAQTVKELGDSANEIGEIIQVINDIADQTNLLALNAAIEAARAGEQGRGFAVVADEVRKLAERTTKATKEIAEKINKIQNETHSAVTSMETGTEEVASGKDLAEKAGDALSNIISSSIQVVDVIAQVATASEEQSGAAEEISRSIELISNLTQESTTAVMQIANASGDLSQLTEDLLQLIKQFKIQKSQQQMLN